MDYLKAFDVQPEPSSEDDWTEEDDEFIEKIVKEIKARRNSEEDAQSLDEEDPETIDSDEGPSEDSEGDES